MQLVLLCTTGIISIRVSNKGKEKKKGGKVSSRASQMVGLSQLSIWPINVSKEDISVDRHKMEKVLGRKWDPADFNDDD